MRMYSTALWRKRSLVLSQPALADGEAWHRWIEFVAMNLCSVQEWQVYEKAKTQEQKHRKPGPKFYNGHHSGHNIYAFPIWRKYRKQASQIAKLHQAFPFLGHFPLAVSSFLVKLIF